MTKPPMVTTAPEHRVRIDLPPNAVTWLLSAIAEGLRPTVGNSLLLQDMSQLAEAHHVAYDLTHHELRQLGLDRDEADARVQDALHEVLFHLPPIRWEMSWEDALKFSQSVSSKAYEAQVALPLKP